MPWTAAEAHAKTHKATSPTAQRQWAHVANGEKAAGASDEEAIRKANAVIRRRAQHSKLRNVTA